MSAAADARAWLHGEADADPRQLVKGLLAHIDLVAVESGGCAPPVYVQADASFQLRVLPWLLQCFGPDAAADTVERCDRFIEEALELVQALGYDLGRVPTLLTYTGNRPAGEPAQEVGGVMVTLAALCGAAHLDMHQSGEVELARILKPEVLEKIRAKQAAKARDIPFSPLPQAQPEARGGAVADRLDALLPELEYSRQTHIEWRDCPQSCRDQSPQIGDSEFHAKAVRDYDERIAAVKEASAALRQPAQPVDYSAAKALREFADAGGHGYRPESLREWADQIEAMQGRAVTAVAQPEARGGEVAGLHELAQVWEDASHLNCGIEGCHGKRALLSCAAELRKHLATPPQQRAVEPVGEVTAHRSVRFYDDPPGPAAGTKVYVAPPVAEKVRGLVVTEAARALCAKLRLVHDDPKYISVWANAQNHGGPYTGPKYADELAALESALASHPQAEQAGEFVRVPVRGYFAASPAEGQFDTFDSLDKAREEAEKYLDWEKDDAADSGWRDEPPQVCYGVIVGECEEVPGSRRPAGEGDNPDFGEIVDYRLTAAPRLEADHNG